MERKTRQYYTVWYIYNTKYFVEAVGSGEILLHPTASIVHATQSKLGIRMTLHCQLREKVCSSYQICLHTLTCVVRAGVSDERDVNYFTIILLSITLKLDDLVTRRGEKYWRGEKVRATAKLPNICVKKAI